jgi:hypothetical protein
MCAHAKEKAANLEKLIVLQNESRRVSTRGWRVGCNPTEGGDISRKFPLFLCSLAYYEHSRCPFHTETIPRALLGF